MGSPKPKASRPLNLVAQQGLLRRSYPGSRILRGRENLVWSGKLTPTEYTATYDVLIDHHIGKSPLVYVIRPRLQLIKRQALPHVYPLNTLCLFLGNREWHSGIPIATTLVPWASEWLFFYELWLATGGQWLGEGEHPPPGPANRHARRSQVHQDASDLMRLSSALRRVYGRWADIEELLYNANLGRNSESGSPRPQR